MKDPRPEHYKRLAQSFQELGEWLDALLCLFIFAAAVVTFIAFLASQEARYLLLTAICFFMLAGKQ